MRRQLLLTVAASTLVVLVAFLVPLAWLIRSSTADRATFEKPHQFAVGVKHVFVNGTQVIKDGEHTGAKPGRALWGPGKVN